MPTVFKKFIITFLFLFSLTASFLTVIFYTYFDNHQTVKLFSKSENDNDLKEKIEKHCKNSLQNLMSGKQKSFICNITVEQKYKEASYDLRVRLAVTKTTNGIHIKRQGQIRNPTQHATEADFCNDCEKTTKLDKKASFQELMSFVNDEAQSVYTDAQTSVNEARKKYNKKDREKRMASLKEKLCEGSWNKSSKEFEEFDIEQRLECKINKISKKNLPVEIEKLYHQDLKKDLWKTAISPDDYILNDLLDNFNDPYKYSFSVRASTSLISNYLDWKNQFEVLDSLEEKQNFVQSIQSNVEQITNFMTKNQSQLDLYFLNQGFDNLFVNSKNQVPSKQTPSLHTIKQPTIQTPSFDYDKVKNQIDGL